jgi:CubicO group peptidase (beta-lactamase class C family)
LVTEKRFDEPPEVAGGVATFHAQHGRGGFPGGQLVVRRRGATLVDEAIGLASGVRPGEPSVQVSPTTRFQVFSASKPFVAMAIALLEERGLLDVEAPLARFVPGWPADRTVLDVLTHRAGLLLPQIVADERRWADREGIIRAISETAPRYPRGTLAYGPYEYGWILAEVVSRVAGEPLPGFLKRELLDPAGIDVSFTTTSDEVARTYWLGGPRVVAGVELSARWEEIHNAAATRATLVPGAGLIATAGALARFYELLLEGGRGLLRPETIGRYTGAHAAGLDRSNRLPLRVGRGFLLGLRLPSLYGWSNTRRCYGHPGAFSAVAYADPGTGAAVAYVTNANRGPYDLLRRAASIGSRVRRSLT